MNTICKLMMLAGCGLGAVWSARGDVLELKNKQIIQGAYQGGTAQSIRFQVGAETRVVPVSDVVALTFTGGGQPAAGQGTGGAAAGTAAGAAAGTAAGAASQPSAQTTAPGQPAAPGQPQAAATTPVTIPAGTSLQVRMDRAVDSSRDPTGTRFSGKLENPVVVNGQVAIPAGATVMGQVAEAQQAGRLKGQSSLDLVLTDVNVNGQTVPLVTQGVAQAGAQEGRKTVRRSGAGAAIGGIAGGGEGAAKGAAIGGATALGKGQAVSVPAGAVLEFRLAQPVTVQAAARPQP